MHSTLTLYRMCDVLSVYIFISLPYSRMETKVKMIAHFRFVLVKFYIGASCSVASVTKKHLCIFDVVITVVTRDCVFSCFSSVHVQ